MPFFSRSYDDMVADGLQHLKQYSNITQLVPGAKARLLLDAVYKEQANQYTLFDENLANAYIRWAEGRFLDFFGDMLNIPRYNATNATADTDGNNFCFYVDSGTFGDINSGLDFIVSSGSVISTADIELETPTYGYVYSEDQQTKIEFDLLTDVICSADQSLAYGNIRARVEGSVSDVPRSVLTVHNFSNYALSSQSLLKCTNRYAISNGRERESDEAYRYRLMNAFKARERGNKLAVRLAALSVPGVANIKEVNYEQGPGTFSLYVRSLTSTTSPGMLAQVQAVVEQVNAFGTKPFVLAPQPLGLEFEIAVNWKSDTTSTQQSAGYALIRQVIENSLNAMEIGASLSLTDLASLVARCSSKILTIGVARPGYFEEVYAYRSAANDSGVRRSLVVGDIVEPLYNERIMLETSTRYRGIKFL